MVSADSLGEHGRDVRCAKCGHIWHQKSEKDSLDELINRIQSEEMDDIDFGEINSSLKKTPAKNKKPLKDILGTLAGKILKPVVALASKIHLPHIGFKLENKGAVYRGIGAAIILFALVAGITIALRQSVINLAPSTKPVFAALGFEDKDPKAEMMGDEETFAIDHVDIDKSMSPPVLKGTVINVTSRTLYIPPVVIEILGKDGESLYKKDWNISEDPLSAEGQKDFALNLEQSLPVGAEKIEFRFLRPHDHDHEQKESDLPVPAEKQSEDHNGESHSSVEAEG